MAAATWIFRGGESRRRRGWIVRGDASRRRCDCDVIVRGGESRRRRGWIVCGDASRRRRAVTWIFRGSESLFRGDESPRQRGRDVDIPWRRRRGRDVDSPVSRGGAAATMRIFQSHAAAPSLIAVRYNARGAEFADELLRSTGYANVTIPHRQNRIVLFDSALFHKTDNFRFKKGYENRRINLTLLFGKMRRDERRRDL